MRISIGGDCLSWRKGVRSRLSEVDGTTSCISSERHVAPPDGLPPDEEVERDVQTAAGASGSTSTPRALGSWDSSLVTFLVGLIAGCKARGMEIDGGGLPEGIQRLLALVRRTPEKGPSGRRILLARARGRRDTGRVAFGRPSACVRGGCDARFRSASPGRARHRRSDLYHEMQEAGAHALPIVTLISLLLGMILAFVGGVTLRNFGATIYVADLVAIAMVRELGAIMTAIIMAGRLARRTRPS